MIFFKDGKPISDAITFNFDEVFPYLEIYENASIIANVCANLDGNYLEHIDRIINEMK